MDKEKIHNAHYFQQRIDRAFARAARVMPYRRAVLGQIGGFDVNFYTPAARDRSAKNILVAAGFHGEEPAGPWGLCRWLETVPQTALTRANISFLPLVSPSAFDRNCRYNIYGENANSGYPSTQAPPEDPLSAEGHMLLKHFNVISFAACDGFLSLHEDEETKGTYLWTYEKDCKTPGPFSYALRETLAYHIPLIEDGRITHGGYDVRLKDAIGFNIYDDTFESYVMAKGAVRAATTETPVNWSFEARVRANADVVRTFVDFVIKN